MAILGNQGVDITLKFVYTGVTCVNKLSYHAELGGEYETPANIADYWVSNMLSQITAIQVDACRIIALTVETNSPPGIPIFFPVTYGLNVPGQSSGEGMPPWDSGVIAKFPDVANSEPELPPTPWRPGAVGFPGLPEGFQEYGNLTSAAVTSLNALGEALESFDVGSVTYLMHMTRRPTETDPQTYVVPVAETAAKVRLGTRNSRKY